jgi:hypothetical protein
MLDVKKKKEENNRCFFVSLVLFCLPLLFIAVDQSNQSPIHCLSENTNKKICRYACSAASY